MLPQSHFYMHNQIMVSILCMFLLHSIVRLPPVLRNRATYVCFIPDLCVWNGFPRTDSVCQRQQTSARVSGGWRSWGSKVSICTFSMSTAQEVLTSPSPLHGLNRKTVVSTGRHSTRLRHLASMALPTVRLQTDELPSMCNWPSCSQNVIFKSRWCTITY